ncbi:MAG TPA: isochorismatase family protein [Gemmatimonadaceae bacterium]|jgi:nicotinamidase-related amidase|nr:isochorismatase family protein [Gemmatimonadaceae bacterium]
MAVTTLDPNTALIIIDLQKGIVSNPSVLGADAVVAHARSLAEAFRAHGLPVVLVTVASGAPGRTQLPPSTAKRAADWAELIPELGPEPGDISIVKRTWGAFASSDLGAQLATLGVTHVVIAGISTSIGVESTARQAYELGLNVTLATDAMSDTNADAHHNSISLIFPRLGETGATREIIALLGARRASA